MLSPKAKRNISRVIPFGIIWLFFSWVFLSIEYMALGSMQNVADSAIKMDLPIFIFSSLAITLVGLIVGMLEILYINKLFINKSFAKKFFFKLIIYALFLFVIILITFPIAASLELETHVLDPLVWERYLIFLTSNTNLSTNLQLTVLLSISLFYAEISENIGHGILLNFFTGKYHKPTEEKRIFMFTDMRNSTSIAEKLGHIRYFGLLREYYSDLSDAIVKHNGELYQYVGDEVIVSWRFKKGIANQNCLACFFAMKADLQKHAKKYKKKFGLVPDFKAGMHFGKVTTGEIGALKKEIIFTGDVLNATARIQGMCNALGVDLLMSEKLKEELILLPSYKFKAMGEVELRGKSEKLELFTAEQT